MLSDREYPAFYRPKSRSTLLGVRIFSIVGVRSRSCGVDISLLRAAFRPSSNPASRPFTHSGSTASSAAPRSPVTASSCSLSATLSSVTSSARSRVADLDVEGFLGGEVGMVGLHGGDDGIDGTPLERMHGRCPSHGALTRPGLRRREAAITPGRCRCAPRGRARSTSLRGGLAARSFGDAAQAFTRWSTGLEFGAAMPHGGGPCKSSPRAPGLVFCPPGGQREVIAGLAISFSMWQCAGHGDAAGLGFVH